MWERPKKYRSFWSPAEVHRLFQARLWLISIRRPELSYEILASVDKMRPELKYDVAEQVNINIKYEGYIKRQKKAGRAV